MSAARRRRFPPTRRPSPSCSPPVHSRSTIVSLPRLAACLPRARRPSPSCLTPVSLRPAAGLPPLAAERWEMAGMAGVLGRHTVRLPSLDVGWGGSAGPPPVGPVRHPVLSCWPRSTRAGGRSTPARRPSPSCSPPVQSCWPPVHSGPPHVSLRSLPRDGKWLVWRGCWGGIPCVCHLSMWGGEVPRGRRRSVLYATRSCPVGLGRPGRAAGPLRLDARLPPARRQSSPVGRRFTPARRMSPSARCREMGNGWYDGGVGAAYRAFAISRWEQGQGARELTAM